MHRMLSMNICYMHIARDAYLLFVVNICVRKSTRNSSRDEIANVNFLYDDIVLYNKIQ